MSDINNNESIEKLLEEIDKQEASLFLSFEHKYFYQLASHVSSRTDFNDFTKAFPYFSPKKSIWKKFIVKLPIFQRIYIERKWKNKWVENCRIIASWEYDIRKAYTLSNIRNGERSQEGFSYQAWEYYFLLLALLKPPLQPSRWRRMKANLFQWGLIIALFSLFYLLAKLFGLDK